MSNEQNNSSGSPGGNAPAASVNPAPPPPELNRSAPANQAPQDNPRARGHSPAMQSREQQQAPAEANRFANGTEHKEADLLAALGERSERQSARATLPASPDQYRIELPADFQAPEGVRFEFDAKDPLLKTARELAHKRGISQEVFSCYPCMRVREWARRSVTRNSAT